MFYKTTKTAIVTLMLIAISQTAIASPISISDVFNNWTKGASIIGNSTAGSWVLSGNSITGTGNHRGSLISDVSLNTDFSFSVNSIARDDDAFGLLWGFQDTNNHYRLTWAQQWGESGVGSSTQGSEGIFDGFKIIKESNGISSILYSSDTEYVRNHNYDISVLGTSNGFALSVKNLTNNTDIFNQSITDTTFQSGKIGIHENYQNNGNAWSNFNVTTSVPEPSSLAIFSLVIIGLASRRMKKSA
jgi:hypothetical protein